LDAFTTNDNETKIRYDLELSLGEPKRWLFTFMVCKSYRVPNSLSDLDQMQDDGEITYVEGRMLNENDEEDGYITFTEKGTFWIYVSTGFNNYLNHKWYLYAKGITATTFEEALPGLLIVSGIAVIVITYLVIKAINKKKQFE